MQIQEFDQILLEEQTITNYTVEGVILGYKFKIRYPSWRGTYLSCIEKLEFKIDQELINENNIYFILNERQYFIEELKDLYKEYWYILDDAIITVIKKGGVTKGIHQITVEMVHRIPYVKQKDKYPLVQSIATRLLIAE